MSGYAAPSIRPARLEEATLLSALALASKAHWGYDAEFLAACVSELTVRRAEIEAGNIFVAERLGRVRGFYGLGWADDTHGASVPEIAYFFVELASMGQGVGYALWQHLEGELRRRRWPVLRIAADPAAEGFYVRMGARRVGTTPAGIGGRTLPLLEFHLVDN